MPLRFAFLAGRLCNPVEEAFAQERCIHPKEARYFERLHLGYCQLARSITLDKSIPHLAPRAEEII